MRVLKVALIVAMLLGWAAPAARAQGNGEAVGVLVVTDGSPKTEALEKRCIEVVKQLRQQCGFPKDRLPILSYHFNKPAERQYCEQVLHISASQLIFVGLAHQRDGRVLGLFSKEYQMSRVQDPDSSAHKVVVQAGKALGIDVEAILADLRQHPKVGLTPTPSPTIGMTPPVTPGVGQVEVQGLQVLSYDGEPSDTFKSDDTGIFFNVYVKNLTPDVAQEHEVTVALIDPQGNVYGRALGGKFRLNPGEPWLGHDVIRMGDPKGNNGFKIVDTPLGSHPGKYKVDVELDGKLVKEQPIDIVAHTLGPADLGVAVVQAYISDEKGNPKTEFKSTDLGAFIFITLQNLKPDDEQTHTLIVNYVDPDGHFCGRPLGGKFTVKKGEDLTRVEFPTDIDKEGGNGFLIRGNAYMQQHLGAYKVQVLLDDKSVQELSFTVSK